MPPTRRLLRAMQVPNGVYITTLNGKKVETITKDDYLAKYEVIEEINRQAFIVAERAATPMEIEALPYGNDRLLIMADGNLLETIPSDALEKKYVILGKRPGALKVDLRPGEIIEISPSRRHQAGQLSDVLRADPRIRFVGFGGDHTADRAP